MQAPGRSARAPDQRVGARREREPARRRHRRPVVRAAGPPGRLAARGRAAARGHARGPLAGLDHRVRTRTSAVP
ncbi:hypothetical protein FFI11_012345 [Oerskovia sp. KBS0722]|nr:hypothetical protein FFI11_012345 [Oerskovia sp. KBS0722]